MRSPLHPIHRQFMSQKNETTVLDLCYYLEKVSIF